VIHKAPHLSLLVAALTALIAGLVLAPTAAMADTVTGTIPTGAGAYTVAFTPDGAKAYVTNYAANTVSVIDTATQTETAEVAVGQSPTGIDITPDGTRAYVLNQSSRTITVIDTATDTALTTFGSLPVAPQNIEISPDGTKAYIATLGSAIEVLDIATNTLGVPITLPFPAYDVTFTPDGTKAYAALYTSSRVSVIDVASAGVTATFALGSSPLRLAASPDGTRVFVANNGGTTLSIIATATNAVSGITDARFSGAVDVAVSADSTKAYVLQFSASEVAVVDLVALSVTDSLAVVTHPTGVEFAPDGTAAYVTGQTAGAISVMGVDSVPVVASTPAVSGSIGSAYSFRVSATGNPAPTFAVTSGALPAGLSLDPTTGVISGSPTSAGTSTFSVTATNANGSDVQAFSLVVAAAAPTTELAATGVDPILLLVVGSVILLLGAVLLHRRTA
jgi:YVTN family beta-propeller protein